MNRSFGHAPPSLEALGSALRLQLCAETLPLRWSDCSATATFLSAYYGGLFRERHGASAGHDLAHSVAYLTNELMENAVKFRAGGDIGLEAGLLEGEFALQISHQVSGEGAAAFSALLEEITAGDPGDLLIQRIEANADTEHSSGSGLGLLTLMSDYQVQFSWTFTSAAAQGETFLLRTLARLPLPAENSASRRDLRTYQHGN